MMPQNYPFSNPINFTHALSQSSINFPRKKIYDDYCDIKNQFFAINFHIFMYFLPLIMGLYKQTRPNGGVIENIFIICLHK
jgi:hypothetical protein